MGQSGPPGDGRVVHKGFLAKMKPKWNFKGMMDLTKQWWGEEYPRKRMQCDGRLRGQGHLEGFSCSVWSSEVGLGVDGG